MMKDGKIFVRLVNISKPGNFINSLSESDIGRWKGIQTKYRPLFKYLYCMISLDTLLSYDKV